MRQLHHLIRQLPCNLDIHKRTAYLGSIYLKQGNYGDTIYHFQQALAEPLYDAPCAALYNLGWAYFLQGDYNRALETNLTVLEKYPDSPLCTDIEASLGKIYFALRDYQNSLLHYRNALARSNGTEMLLYEIAETHMALGQMQETQKTLLK